MEVLKWSIGYGLTGRFPLRVLTWVTVLTVIGALVLSIPPSKAALEHSLLWCVFASFDQLLPIVEINKEFGDFFNDPGRKRLAAWQTGYFSIHVLLGFLLGSFVVAGLSGLTQARR